MCRECKKQCIGFAPCGNCVVNDFKVSVPNSVVAGLIMLVIYFMWR